MMLCLLARVGRWAWLPTLLIVLAVSGAVVSALSQGPSPASRLDDLPLREGGLPDVPVDSSKILPPPPFGAAEADAGAPPLLVQSDLVEATPVGRLPRIGAGGRRPAEVYRRHEPGGRVGAARVAIILIEIGLSRSAAEHAATLPAPIAFAVSPYATDGPGWQNWVRLQGREALLTLPMAAGGSGADDAGPDALRPDAVEDGGALMRLLARGRAYPAVVLQAGAFATRPAQFVPIALALNSRGLGVIELGEQSLALVAAQAGLPFLAASGPIDADSSAQGIDGALAAIERRALAQGRAIGYGRPIPITIERLSAWASASQRKGIRLVGPGELLQP